MITSLPESTENISLLLHNSAAFDLRVSDVNEGLVVIPDISGFSHFVENTDIKTGSYITSELLSAILQSNYLGLRVSEIEGDAILFYRPGKAPTINDMMSQAMEMREAFNTRLESMISLTPEAKNLSLKVIVHYGPMTSFLIEGIHRKLYGPAVVEAHNLLKNSIEGHSYILLTEAFQKASGFELPKTPHSKKEKCDLREGEVAPGSTRYRFLSLNENSN